MLYSILLFPIIISAGIVLYFLPKIMFLSLKNRLLDRIDNRKVHSTAASRLGGASFLPAIAVALILTSVFFDGVIQGVNLQLSSNSLLILCSMIILYFVGLYDDIVGIRYKKKFLFQFLTATLVVYSGGYIDNFNGLFGIEAVNIYLGIPLSIILIVFITNAINLIDGIDGLASMLSIMAFIVYAIMFVLQRDYVDALFCLSAVGALTPFWYHNVFGVRKGLAAKIFMGDSGALVVGFLLSVMALKLWGSSTFDSDSGSRLSENSWILGYTMLIIPCFDVVRVFVYRLVHHKSPFLPDKNHFHHRLMALGYTSRQSLYLIILFNAVFVTVNWLTALYGVHLMTIILLDIILWLAIHRTISYKIKRLGIEIEE
ncbi:MAG: MraY family glycosyltransferase [Rikenellaceae bacterium]